MKSVSSFKLDVGRLSVTDGLSTLVASIVPCNGLSIPAEDDFFTFFACESSEITESVARFIASQQE